MKVPGESRKSKCLDQKDEGTASLVKSV